MYIPILLIKRRGECKACGYCCPPTCPHFKDNLCTIHDFRQAYCEECGQTHQECIDAPVFPMKRAHKECGYYFITSVGSKDLEVYEMLCCELKDD